MDEQQPPQHQRPWYAGLRTVMIVLLCVCPAAALCDVNLRGCYFGQWYDDRGGRGDIFLIGWPAIYGETTVFPPTCPMRGAGVLLDVFVTIILIASVPMAIRLWQSAHQRQWQFTLLDLFSLTTAIAVLFSILASERTYAWMYRWSNLTSVHQEQVYSALSAYPWYDQVPISIGIVCAVYLMLAALRQLVRLAVGK